MAQLSIAVSLDAAETAQGRIAAWLDAAESGNSKVSELDGELASIGELIEQQRTMLRAGAEL